MANNIYEAYSDESGFPAERFQGIGVISGSNAHLASLRQELANVLKDKGIKEVKFKEVRGHRPKVEAACRFYDLAIDYSAKRKIRIDVLIWDLQDSRHAVTGRDNIANFHRMYYKILINLARRWRVNVWKFFPDENSGIAWWEIQAFLNKTRLNRPRPELLRLFDSSEEHKSFRFSVEPRSSHEEPLIQLADLFAGLAVCSRNKGDSYLKWLRMEQSRGQPLLFDEEEDVPEDTSKSDLVRFCLLKYFDEECKKRKLGVSIKEKRYLHTFNPKNPINFWNYEPQHDTDKAPTISPNID